jgi:hypothetical protein
MANSYGRSGTPKADSRVPDDALCRHYRVSAGEHDGKCLSAESDTNTMWMHRKM